jgi:hypothetical protein
MLSSMLRIGCGAAPPISSWRAVKPPPVVRRARRCWTSTKCASQTGAYSRGGPFVDVVAFFDFDASPRLTYPVKDDRQLEARLAGDIVTATLVKSGGR